MWTLGVILFCGIFSKICLNLIIYILSRIHLKNDDKKFQALSIIVMIRK